VNIDVKNRQQDGSLSLKNVGNENYKYHYFCNDYIQKHHMS